MCGSDGQRVIAEKDLKVKLSMESGMYGLENDRVQVSLGATDSEDSQKRILK